MKKFLLLLFVAIAALPTPARDFEYTYEGQTITYTVTDETAKTCSTKAGTLGNAGNLVSGNLVIPDVVRDGDTEYRVSEISYNSFQSNLNLISVVLPNTIKVIAEGAFNCCKALRSIVMSDSVVSIGENAFYYCESLTSITLPECLTYIGDWAFGKCSKLTSLLIPGSVTHIGTSAFSGCVGLKTISIPESLSGFGENVFSGCSGILSFNFPESIKTITGGFLSGCSGLKTVMIPSSVNSIESFAFQGCTKVNSIYSLNPTPPSATKASFVVNTGIPAEAKVYIPKGSLAAYKAAEGWSYFSNFIEIGAVNLSLSATDLDIMEGSKKSLSANIAKDEDVFISSSEWKSSNPDIAVVDENGTVTGIAVGTAKISFIVTDGYGLIHTKSCNVRVIELAGIDEISEDVPEDPIEYYNLQGIKVSGENLRPGIYILRQGRKVFKIAVR